MFWWRAARSAVVVAALFLVAACGEDDKGLKAHIGKVWDLNVHTGLKSINGLSAVTVHKAEVLFDGEDQPVALEATSSNKKSWLITITTEGFFNSVEPHDKVSIELLTVIPDNPDWVDRTGKISWDVTIVYPRVLPDNDKQFEEKTTRERLEWPIKFLAKKAEG